MNYEAVAIFYCCNLFQLTGSNIVMNVNNDEQMVSELLSLKEKTDSIATTCFAGLDMYTLAIRY